jgi:hypothetical protein
VRVWVCVGVRNEEQVRYLLLHFLPHSHPDSPTHAKTQMVKEEEYNICIVTIVTSCSLVVVKI